MPDGITHELFREWGRKITFPAFLLSGVGLSYLPLKDFYHIPGGVLIGVGMFTGYELGKYVTPDWDIAGLTKDEGRLINDLPVFGWLLVGVSTIYGIAFRKHHRSFWTHFPFVSTAIRFVYLFWLIWWWIYNSPLDLSWLIFIFIGAYIGMSISDWIHWFLDITKGGV